MPDDKLDFFRTQAASIDQWIREGEGQLARNTLKKIIQKKIPRKFRSDFAWVAWRLRLPGIGIQLLNPIVRPTAKNPVQATDAEKSEYAVCLARVGAAREAFDILKSVNPLNFHRSLLYQAFVHVSQWNYRESKIVLKKYLGAHDLNAYERRVAEVNLLAAYVVENEGAKAQQLIDHLIPTLLKNKEHLLYGSVLDFAAQNSIKQRNLKEAEKYLNQAESAFRKIGGLESLYIRKWKSVLKLIREPNSSKSLMQIQQVRSSALSQNNWETVRSCDTFEATLTHNEKLFSYVYYGTPYLHYRKLMARDYTPKSLPGHYWWQIGNRANGKLVSIDLNEDFASQKGSLTSNNTLMRLLKSLCMDFYRPSTLAEIFASTYSGEFYNPVTSPLKTHQTMFRLRNWLSQSKIPLEIIHSPSGYRLNSKGNCRIKLPDPSTSDLGPTEKRLQTINDRWPNSRFSIREAAKLIGTTERTALKVLGSAIEQGTLIRQGKARACRYQFSILASNSA